MNFWAAPKFLRKGGILGPNAMDVLIAIGVKCWFIARLTDFSLFLPPTGLRVCQPHSLPAANHRAKVSGHETSRTRAQSHFHGITGAPSGLLPSAQQIPHDPKFVGSPDVVSALKTSLLDGAVMLMVISLLWQLRLQVVN